MECKNPTISTILTSLTVNSRTEQPIRSILEYQLSLGIPTQVNAWIMNANSHFSRNIKL